MAYLDDHPNRTLAQQRPRRDRVSGVVVVHTAESALDVIGEDTGAEGVARYIGTRGTYGSYHRLVDSDSIVAVARLEMTTYGDGTGSNDHAIHLSFACRAADWPGMSAERKAAFVRNGAKAAREIADWLKSEHGITLPARRISRVQSDQRVPGFISHGERDPGRRTDPGPAFPWADFLDQFSTDQEDQIMAADVTKILARLESIEKSIAKVVEQNGRIRKRVNASAKELRKIAREHDREVGEFLNALADRLDADVAGD